jgi:hypothetical protein
MPITRFLNGENLIRSTTRVMGVPPRDGLRGSADPRLRRSQAQGRRASTWKSMSTLVRTEVKLYLQLHPEPARRH